MPRNDFGYEPIGENYHQVLELNIDDIRVDLYGYDDSCFRSFLYHLLGVLFLGIPYIVSTWFSCLQTIKYRKCNLKHARVVQVRDAFGNNELHRIKTEDAKLPDFGHTNLRFFYYRHAKFVWLHHQEVFGSLDMLIPSQSVDFYLNNNEGLFYDDYIDLLKLYGPNKIEIEVKSYWTLFVEEVFNPFYVFQVFSMLLWGLDHYYVYMCCVLILTFFSVITSLRQTRKQSEALHDLVESSKCDNVQVMRRSLLSENILQDAEPSELVPGDLIVLPKNNFILPCDLVLLTGQCIVNESMLTGESVPVLKISLVASTDIYTPSTHNRHTLFAGTHMIQSRYYGGEPVLARVISTGFNTAKGALVKSILFPTPVGLQFYKDSLKFVLALFCIAAGGTSYCLYLYIHRKAHIMEMIIRSLDIVTIVVPPALPAAMTVGIVYSQNRLKRLKIFCISPPRINICGKIKLACFDKTGTLTQEGLDMHSALPCIDSHYHEPITDCHSLDNHSRFVQAMATCHELTQIDGKLTGDPLDLSMFEFTKWHLEEPGDDETARFDLLAPTVVKPEKYSGRAEGGDAPEFPYQIGIIRQFPFSSTLQCMSVICKELDSKCMVAFTKGAPEKVSSMCLPQSLPEDFSKRLARYAEKGFRVIGLAYKELPTKFRWKEAQRAKRDLIECELHFLGLLVMQNTLKPETTPVIRLLHSANIRTVMITGDNILTAISVARDCEMVRVHDQIFTVEIRESDERGSEVFLQSTAASSRSSSISVDFDSRHYHLAIDGKTWNKIKTNYPDLLPSLLVRTTVFARFQPDQKTQLITYFQSLDYVVSMVGDGANDCGALKAAHVGVSLSQAEASVAAPFTSAVQDISCIIHLIMEGRCALVTSFAVFKYMALYSLIQFTTVLILTKQHSLLGDVQFLFIDLVITTTLAITIGRQGPSNKLHVRRPPGSLVAGSTLIPILLQVALCVVVQIGTLFYLYQQDWFAPVPDKGKELVTVCWENTVLFLVSSFQYLILAFVYSKGRPYRQMLISNFWFLVSILALTCFQVWLSIRPTKEVAEFFEIMFLPHSAHEQIYFRYNLLLIPVGHLLAAIFIEVGKDLGGRQTKTENITSTCQVLHTPPCCSQPPRLTFVFVEAGNLNLSLFLQVAIADREWFRKFLHFITLKRIPKNKYKLLLQDSNIRLNLVR